MIYNNMNPLKIIIVAIITLIVIVIAIFIRFYYIINKLEKENILKFD